MPMPAGRFESEQRYLVSGVLLQSGGIPASRVVRGAVLGVKENAYFEAAQAIGSSRRRSLLRHVLPNVAAPTPRPRKPDPATLAKSTRRPASLRAARIIKRAAQSGRA